jgi:hypothetical protein
VRSSAISKIKKTAPSGANGENDAQPHERRTCRFSRYQLHKINSTFAIEHRNPLCSASLPPSDPGPCSPSLPPPRNSWAQQRNPLDFPHRSVGATTFQQFGDGCHGLVTRRRGLGVILSDTPTGASALRFWGLDNAQFIQFRQAWKNCSCSFLTLRKVFQSSRSHLGFELKIEMVKKVRFEFVRVIACLGLHGCSAVRGTCRCLISVDLTETEWTPRRRPISLASAREPSERR